MDVSLVRKIGVLVSLAVISAAPSGQTLAAAVPRAFSILF
jgi:hypothetical protein